MLECITEKRKSQCTHGQPMEQTRSLFCTCDSGVSRCQLQHQCHFWQMNSIFEAHCTGKWAWQLSIIFYVIHKVMNGCKNLKIHSRIASKMKILDRDLLCSILKTIAEINQWGSNPTFFAMFVETIRIYHECEGRIEKNPSRGSPFGITRLAEWWQTVIPRDGFFYPTLTRITVFFSCSQLFLLINLFIISNKLPEVPENANMDVTWSPVLDSVGKIRFSIPG